MVNIPITISDQLTFTNTNHIIVEEILADHPVLLFRAKGEIKLSLPSDPAKIKCRFFTTKALAYSRLIITTAGARPAVEADVNHFFDITGVGTSGTLFFDGEIWRIM